jgi:hypothetical protein
MSDLASFLLILGIAAVPAALLGIGKLWGWLVDHDLLPMPNPYGEDR